MGASVLQSFKINKSKEFISVAVCVWLKYERGMLNLDSLSDHIMPGRFEI